MKRPIFTSILIGLFLSIYTLAGQSQDVIPMTAPYTAIFPSGLHLFTAIVTGLILAIAFQLILTHLSIAFGISALSSMTTEANPDTVDTQRHHFASGKEKEEEQEEVKRGSTTKGDSSHSHEDTHRGSVTVGDTRNTHEEKQRGSATVTKQEKHKEQIVSESAEERLSPGTYPWYTSYLNTTNYDNPYHSYDMQEIPANLAVTIRKYTNYCGIWTLLTSGISLFFASWLAVELSLTASLTVGAVLGIVIWGLFYITVCFLETTAITSLLGSMSNVATSGLRSLSDTAASLFTKSQEKRLEESATRIAGAVRDEFFRDVESNGIYKRIQEYIDQLEPRKMDAQHIRREIEKLLSDLEIHAIAKPGGPLNNEEEIVATLQKKSGMSKEQAARVAQTLRDTIVRIIEDTKDKETYTEKIQEASLDLSGMSEQEKHDFQEKVRNYLQSTGKEELNPEGIQRDLEKLIQDPSLGLQALRERLSQFDRSTLVALLAQRNDLSEEEANRIVEKIQGIINQFRSNFPSIEASVEEAMQKIYAYFDQWKSSEDAYAYIQQEAQHLFHEKETSTESLLNRLKKMDRDSLRALLSIRRDITNNDAERILQRLESARDTVIQKLEQMRDEVDRRIFLAKGEAMHIAEEARKTAALAAWWTFGSAIVSGLAAVIGGMIAVITGT